MRYISCFSGVGGLEATQPPSAYCEIDESCRKVLTNRFPDAIEANDVSLFKPPRAEVTVGGWPCQDLSVAGAKKGLTGERSKLFYELVRVAKESKSHTIVAENVPNLLTMNDGAEFVEVLNEFDNAGFNHVCWRILNAREFGLPHERRRVIIIASKEKAFARTIHREIPSPKCYRKKIKLKAAGFYWTAGIQSICYNDGFIPTLKVGSSLGIPSPPAVHFGDTVRKLTPKEALNLQGFDEKFFSDVKSSCWYQMAGNAVAVPIGKFVLDGLTDHTESNFEINQQDDLFGSNREYFSSIPRSGEWRDRNISSVKYRQIIDRANLATNLSSFIDLSNKEDLSIRAASGFLLRLQKSGKSCPDKLYQCLQRIIEED